MVQKVGVDLLSANQLTTPCKPLDTQVFDFAENQHSLFGPYGAKIVCAVDHFVGFQVQAESPQTSGTVGDTASD